MDSFPLFVTSLRCTSSGHFCPIDHSVFQFVPPHIICASRPYHFCLSYRLIMGGSVDSAQWSSHRPSSSSPSPLSPSLPPSTTATMTTLVPSYNESLCLQWAACTWFVRYNHHYPYHQTIRFLPWLVFLVYLSIYRKILFLIYTEKLRSQTSVSISKKLGNVAFCLTQISLKKDNRKERL